MRRKSIISLCMLSALLAGAVAAQSADAAIGTTAFTCGKGGSGGFSDAFCEFEKEGGAYGHIAIAENTETKLTGTNFFSPGFTLHSTIAGIAVEFSSSGLSGSGAMVNTVEATEHRVSGSGVAEFSSVSVVKPAGKGCTVKSGKVVTNKLKATTAGQGMGLKFEPSEGTVLAEFSVEGCSIAALNGKYEVTGSAIAETLNETTISFSRTGTTSQGTLKLRGQKAGIEGTFEFAGANGNPLVATTVLTP